MRLEYKIEIGIIRELHMKNLLTFEEMRKCIQKINEIEKKEKDEHVKS